MQMTKTTTPIQVDLVNGDLISLGQALAQARQARGWSQKRLAEAAGSTQGVVSGLELGKTDSLTSTLQRHLDALGAHATLSISVPADGGASNWGQK